MDLLAESDQNAVSPRSLHEFGEQAARGPNRPIVDEAHGRSPGFLQMSMPVIVGSCVATNRRFGGRRKPPAGPERPTDHDAIADAIRTGTQFELHVALKRARWPRQRPALAACAAFFGAKT